MKKERIWLVVTIIYCIAIFITTASPVSTGASSSSLFLKLFNLTEQEAATINVFFRKSVHLSAFGVLAILFYKSFSTKPYIKAWVFTTLYAATDELHQVFIPNRTGTVIDVVIDSIGAIIGLLIVKLIIVYKENRFKKQRSN